jgi:hypothetical protein
VPCRHGYPGENDGWIQWTKEADLRRVQGKQIQLRFTLQNARLRVPRRGREVDETSRARPPHWEMHVAREPAQAIISSAFEDP